MRETETDRQTEKVRDKHNSYDQVNATFRLSTGVCRGGSVGVFPSTPIPTPPFNVPIKQFSVPGRPGKIIKRSLINRMYTHVSTTFTTTVYTV